MATEIDIAALITSLKTTLSATIGQDIAQLQGFSEQQLQAIAQQAKTVAAGIADGSITGATQAYLLKSLADLAKSYANTLAGLVAVSVEELWNAMVNALWGAINTATGLALKIPAA